MSLTREVSDRNVNALRLELSVQRSLHQLTYDGLAALSGVSRRALIAIETGQSRGSLETWMKISQALECDFSAFVESSQTGRDLTVPLFVPDTMVEQLDVSTP